MTNRNTVVALSAALALAILGNASIAHAGDQGEERGGFVIPGSTDGVNPVYHPEWFGKKRNADRAGDAFGYAPVPGHKHKSR
jgi:hypothetical protein